MSDIADAPIKQNSIMTILLAASPVFITETSMDIMYPMPPTSNETLAMLASNIVMMLFVDAGCMSLMLRTEKSSASCA